MSKLWVLIDDLRNYDVDIIARTAMTGKRVLAYFKGDIEAAMFDHDLGEETSGYDVLVWAIENECLPNHIQLVTANPVGRENMTRALEEAGYVARPGGVIFDKSV